MSKTFGLIRNPNRRSRQNQNLVTADGRTFFTTVKRQLSLAGVEVVEGDGSVRRSFGWYIDQLVARFHRKFNYFNFVGGDPGMGKSYLTLQAGYIFTKALNAHQERCAPCRLRIWQSVCPKCRMEFQPCSKCVINTRMKKIRPVEFHVLPDLESEDNVIFDIQKYFSLIRKSPSGTTVVLDEAGTELDAHMWMTQINRLMKWTSQTFRWRQIFIHYCTQDLSFLDVNSRRLLTSMMVVLDRGYARVYKLKKDFTGEMWRKGMGVLDNVGLPPQELLVPYERKKRKAYEMLAMNIEEQSASAKMYSPYSTPEVATGQDITRQDLDQLIKDELGEVRGR